MYEGQIVEEAATRMLVAAEIMAATQSAAIRVNGMKALNKERSRHGLAMAYSDDAFDEIDTEMRAEISGIMKRIG